MENNNNPSSFISFPSHIVPAATVPLDEIPEKVKDIERKISEQYNKLADIKNNQGESSKAWKTVSSKIQDLEAKVAEVYSNNPQWQWATQFGNAIIGYGKSSWTNRTRLLDEYANAMVNPGEFTHITELYAGPLGKALPAYLRQVNRAPAVLNRIVGEADAQGLRYSVSVINSDAVNDKIDKHAAEMANMITRMARKKAGVSEMLGKPIEPQDEGDVPEPSEFKNFNFNTYELDEETMVKRGLDYLMRKPDLAFKYKFSHMGLRNYVTNGELCFEVWDDIEDPNITPVMSKDLFYILSPSSPFIQHGMGAGRYFAETPQGLIDMMPEMSASEVERLKSMALNYQGGQMDAEIINRNGCFEVLMHNKARYLYLHCWTFNFRATKRVRVRIMENKYDMANPHIKYVDDKDDEKGATYEYRFVEEIWEGTRYGNDGWYQLRPVPNQHIVGDYIAKKTLNFVGVVDPNPSLIQLIQPFESLRIQVFYAIERLMAQVQGKIMCIDEANESDNADNAYNMKVYSLYRYNSAKEGDQQLLGPGGAKNLNKPEVLDLGLSNAINDLMRFIQFIDMNVDAITGINGARRGEIKSDTGLGQQEQANAQSAMSTTPYFSTYYTVIGMTLEKVCEQMQRSWGGKDIVKNFLGQNGMELLNLMSKSEWNLPQYGIFLENSVGDDAVKDKIFNLAQALMPIQTDPNLALSLIKMLNANSSKEAEKIFEDGVSAMNRINDMTAKSQQANAQAQQALIKSEEDNKNLREQIKAASAKTVAEVNKSAKLEDTQLKLGHRENEQTVGHKQELDKLVATKELESGAMDQQHDNAMQQQIQEQMQPSV